MAKPASSMPGTNFTLNPRLEVGVRLLLTSLGSDLFSSLSVLRRMLAGCSRGSEAEEACFPLREGKNKIQKLGKPVRTSLISLFSSGMILPGKNREQTSCSLGKKPLDFLNLRAEMERP